MLKKGNNMKFWKISYINKDDINHKYLGTVVCFPLIPFTWIKIRLSEKNNKGLLMHEIEHAKQHLKTLTLHPILYSISKKYKFWAEVQAYKKQLEYSTDRKNDLVYYSIWLSKNYDLDITPLEVLKKLME